MAVLRRGGNARWDDRLRLLNRRRMLVTKKTPEQTMAMLVAAVGCANPRAHGCAEWFILGVLVGILFTIIHLLFECLGLFLIAERQGCQTILKLEGVEENTVLVVGEGIVYFLVPYHTAIRWLYPVSLTPFSAFALLTETSTSLIQNVLPTRSFASTAAP